MNSDAPPLKVWYYVVGSILCILISFVVIAYVLYPTPYEQTTYSYKESLEKSIQHNYSKKGNKPYIVFFGSSVLRTDIPDDNYIERVISAYLNKEVEVLLLPLPELNMNKAEYCEFYKHMVNYPPDYLFLEHHRLNTEDSLAFCSIEEIKKQRNMSASLRYTLLDFKFFSKYILGINPIQGTERTMQKMKSNIIKFDTTQFYNLFGQKIHVLRKFKTSSIANQAYKQLKEKGTKVIFLDFPKAALLENTYTKDIPKNQLQSMIKFYKNTYNIDFWQFPSIMPDSCFSDGGHLNYNGSVQYQDWFVKKFSTTYGDSI